MSAWVDRILSALDRILQIIAVVLLGVVAFAVTAQVLARYVVTTSTPWTVELASYSFVWLSMIGIALGVRRGRHMVLDVWEYLPYRKWAVVLLDEVAALIIASVLLVLIWYGFEAAKPGFRRTMPGLGLPFAYVNLAVPVGSVLALIFAIEAWWKGVHAKRGEEPLPQKLLFQPDDEIVIKGEI